ncbi:MAG TPA: hypothetical protein VFP84_02505, partial [Kofleriaceae bacterium]|nr:hypothetical protein [Kofleriaceae bacterium]
PRPETGFVVERAGAPALVADAVVLATGHRAPLDPLAERWRGPRTRFIADPWPSLAAFAIAGDEPVVVLGSGLSAIDAVLTLTRGPRSAPIVCVSRHGLLTRDHAPASAPPPHVDLAPAIERWRAAPTLRGLVAVIRRAIDDAGAWRPVIDAVRPHTARIWAALPVDDAAAFLRHVRPLWEVHRHRMAPGVAAIVDHHARAGTFRVVAGRVTRVDATATSATLEVAQRGGGACTLAASWVVNCTGPGSHHTPAPPIAGLIAAGALEADPLGLGVVTGERGEAIAGGRPRDDLFVIGTLCKPRLWESTAVPELRAQAEIVARALVAGRGRVK